MRTRTLRAALVAGLLLTLPATAHAATATVSNEDGADVTLGAAPTTVAFMAPVVKVQFADTEKRYALKVTGPAGTDAAPAVSCRAVSGPAELPVSYQGNGNYTVAITTSTNANDIPCAEGQTNQLQFAISASATVAGPNGIVRSRKPGDSAFIPYKLVIGATAGADSIELAVGRNVTPQADGSLPGTPRLLTAPASAKTTTVTFEKPGRYTIVARPKLDGVGPWSAPITVDVVAPFDLVSAPGFSASRAPKYVLKGDVRAALPKGSKLKVSIAKGRKGGKFSPLKKIKTGKGGKFKLRFKLSDPGSYRIRYAFRGSKTVAAGRVTQLIKVKKVNI